MSLKHRHLLIDKNMTYANLGKHIEVILMDLPSITVTVYISLSQLTFELGDKVISDASDVFDCCRQLTSIELVGNIHKAISAMGLEQWQADMYQEIDCISTSPQSTLTDHRRLRN